MCDIEGVRCANRGEGIDDQIQENVSSSQDIANTEEILKEKNKTLQLFRNISCVCHFVFKNWKTEFFFPYKIRKFTVIPQYIIVS